MDKILKESNLQILSDRLHEIGSPYTVAVQYLRTLKDLYHLMVSKRLASNWQKIIDDFRRHFDMCYDLELINMTPKCHMLYDHLWQWIDATGETLFFADTSGKCPLLIFLHRILHYVQFHQILRPFLENTCSTKHYCSNPLEF